MICFINCTACQYLDGMYTIYLQYEPRTTAWLNLALAPLPFSAGRGRLDRLIVLPWVH